MKNLLRWIVYWACVLCGSTGEFRADAGTLKFRFLNWLYEGDAEPEFDATRPETRIPNDPTHVNPEGEDLGDE